MSLPERVAALEQDAEQSRLTRADLEQRMRKLERAYYVGTGVLAALQLVLKFLN